MTESPAITTMLVDQDAIVRDGLEAILERAGGFEVVGQAGDGESAVELAQRFTPDVIIMETQLPGTTGIDACWEITQAMPETRVLVLTGSTDEQAAVEAFAAGAAGYLTKHADRETLLATLRDVAAGEFRIPSDVALRVFTALRDPQPPRGSRRRPGLTPREREILGLYAQGGTYAQIAREDGRSPHTIRNAMTYMRRKLGVKSNQELVVWAVRSGLLDEVATVKAHAT